MITETSSEEPQQFRLNTPAVALQIAEGEAILIHFDSGTYYSANPLGTEIIRLLLEESQTVPHLTKALCAHFACETEAAVSSVVAFCAELLAERLVVPRTMAEEPATARNWAEDTAQPGWPHSFEAPALHKYSDLEELLAIDPIHEVDEQGWPALPGSAV